MTVIFLAYRSWGLRAAHMLMQRFSTTIDATIIESPDALSLACQSLAPNQAIVVALGWSWLIEKAITENQLCLGVHPSDLPNYRGGSPIQNQILDGIEDTKLSLFHITEKLDAGDIWGKTHLSLKGDSMEDIFANLESSSIQLLSKFFLEYPNIRPTPQDLTLGCYRKRRKPEESRLQPADFSADDLKSLYNKIRCLTAPYPSAYLEDAKGNRLYFEAIRFTPSTSTDVPSGFVR